MTDSKIGAVILAAGLSRRFGTDNKLLAIVDGKPIIESVLKTVVACQFDRVVVVVQSTDNAVGEIARKFPITMAVNPRPADGMGSSLSIGVAALADRQLDGVAVFPGDVPFIQPQTITELCDRFAGSGCRNIVRPFVDDQPGHPVQFPADLMGELCQITGDAGGRILIEQYPDRVERVQIKDRGAVTDVDRPGDLS